MNTQETKQEEHVLSSKEQIPIPISLLLALRGSFGTHTLAPQATSTNLNVRELTGGTRWGFFSKLY